MEFLVGPGVIGDGSTVPLVHAIVILPHVSACFVPVVTMVASEMSTAASGANTWQRSCFLV
jgi:hypothetical protein